MLALVPVEMNPQAPAFGCLYFDLYFDKRALGTCFFAIAQANQTVEAVM